MTDDNGAVASKKKPKLKLPSQVDPAIAEQLVEQARDEGVDLIGPGGLLGELTKQVLETGLEVEMEEHLGYAKHSAEGRDGGNSRNGTRSKKVLTEVGPVEIDVPRDRDGTFEPNSWPRALLRWRIRATVGEGRPMRTARRRHRSDASAFAGYRFPPEVILLAVRWYLRYGLSTV